MLLLLPSEGGGSTLLQKQKKYPGVFSKTIACLVYCALCMYLIYEQNKKLILRKYNFFWIRFFFFWIAWKMFQHYVIDDDEKKQRHLVLTYCNNYSSKNAFDRQGKIAPLLELKVVYLHI